MENLEEFKRLAKQHNTEILLLGDDYTDCDWFFMKKMALVDILYLFHLQKCTK